MEDEKFHNERNVIITTKDEIIANDVEEYLKKNLQHFPKGAKFIVFCGHHHRCDDQGNVHIGKTESGIVAQYDSIFENVIQDCSQPCENKCGQCEKCLYFNIWQEKAFKMGFVIPIFTKEDEDGKYHLNQRSKNVIKFFSQDLMKTDSPHVVIFGSCHSQKSEIKHLMRSSGLFAAICMATDRGEITCGKLFELDPEQQDMLNTIVNDLNIKDVILSGEAMYIFQQRSFLSLLIRIIIDF